MNGSLRWRLFVWLSVSIVVMGAATAALSFVMNFRDANDLQDTQLEQVAAVLARQPVVAPLAHFEPRDGEDAETHFVVRELGSQAVDPNPKIDVFLPESLQPGLQSIEARGVHWRVMVTRNLGGQRFAVAQRQTVRDEVARDSAVLTLVPMLVLVPLLLLIVNLVLRQGFARLVALSREVDQVDGNHLAALDPSQVPREALALVRNAIDNGVKYTPAGGAVDVSVELVDGVAVFAVEDTGPGIDAALHDRVFEPFFRILGSQRQGSGLGLAIVRSAASALGGRVELAARRDGRAGLRFIYRQKTS